MPSFAVILAAAGKSTRFGDKNTKKPFTTLGDKAVWLHSAEKFLKRDDVKQLIVVLDAEDREDFQFRFGANVAILGIDLVEGGAQRADSVGNGLAAVRDEIDYVAVHDAARPCIADEWIEKVFDAAVAEGAAILADPITSTLKRAGGDQKVEATVSRERLWAAQTPQVFRKSILQKAYAQKDVSSATDEAQLAEQIGIDVRLVQCSPINIKITTKDDLKLATHLLKALPKPKNIGPAHPFEDGDLWR